MHVHETLAKVNFMNALNSITDTKNNLPNNLNLGNSKTKDDIPHHLLIDAVPINARTAKYKQNEFFKQIEKLNDIAQKTRQNELKKNADFEDNPLRESLKDSVYMEAIDNKIEKLNSLNGYFPFPNRDEIFLLSDEEVEFEMNRVENMKNALTKNDSILNESDTVEVPNVPSFSAQQAIDTYRSIAN